MKTLKLVAISDTHNRHGIIKPFLDFDPHLMEDKEPLGGDIIFHSGDATGGGKKKETEDFLKWYGGLDFKHKVFTPGNHDFFFQRNRVDAEAMCEHYGVTLLNHQSIELEGIKIFGSPWTPWFHDWAFNGARNVNEEFMYHIPRMKVLWETIPLDTNILITHGPPYEILDELTFVDGTPKGQFVGCVDLTNKIKELKDLDIHIFGHIHCGYGERHIDGVSYYNACTCDEAYYPSNAPHIIEYVVDKTS